MSASERERLETYARDLLERDQAIASANARIHQLAGMVNRYALQLGLGRKIRAEDWSVTLPAR